MWSRLEKKIGRPFKKTGINEDKAGLLREENIAKYDFLEENLYSQCNSI